MKNILIIAYYYPPKGGAGVQRTAKFANYLSKFGYNVNVLTVVKDASGLKDDSLNKDIYSNINVYRTDIKETNVLNNLLALRNKAVSNKVEDKTNTTSEVIESKSFKSNIKNSVKNIAKKYFFNMYNFVYAPDDKKGWTEYAIREGRKIIKEKDIDLIFSTSSPYTSHLIGYELSKEFKIKWIADFRDPWVSNAFVDYGPLTKKRHESLEAKVIKNSDKVISVSEPIIRDFINRYKDEDRDKFHVITNGYDESDFSNFSPYNNEKKDQFVILHNGSLYGEKRTPEKIFAAVENLINSNKISANKIKFEFLGEIGSEHKKIVDYFEIKYPGMVECKNYVPHEESLIEMSKADALLLFIHEGKGTEGIYTGKIFEYIRAGKPIIALVPDGVARDLILSTNTGFVAYPSRVDEIEESIYKAYCVWSKEDCSMQSNWEEIHKYSRENLTKQLIEVINSLE